MMKLFYKNTDIEVGVGDAVRTFRGEAVEVTGWREPAHAGSTGRVYVKYPGKEWTAEFFPSVINAEWKE